MMLTDFLRRFVAHVTLALGAWLVAALTLERVVPGFVTPFVNVPGTILVFAILSAISLATFRGEVTIGRRVLSMCLLAAMLIALLLFLWTRLDGLGGMALLLLASGFVAGVLLLVSFWSNATRS